MDDPFTFSHLLLYVGDGYMNTFQLIAFLLSIFNIAALMVSNANNNNRNDNINDNQVYYLLTGWSSESQNFVKVHFREIYLTDNVKLN
jgi:hypothetical protein